VDEGRETVKKETMDDICDSALVLVILSFSLALSVAFFLLVWKLALSVVTP
jgi:hypothetical protein